MYVFVASSIICETSASKAIEREVDVSVTDMSRTTVDFVIRGKANAGVRSFVYKVSLSCVIVIILVCFFNVESSFVQVIVCELISTSNESILYNLGKWVEKVYNNTYILLRSVKTKYVQQRCTHKYLL